MNQSNLSPERQTIPEADSLGEKLKVIIAKLPPNGVTMAGILKLVGTDGLMILSGLLSLVFLIPVSIPGVSTVFGAAILMIAVSRLFGRNLWLPKSLRDRVIATDTLRTTFDRALVWLAKLEKVCRPHRMSWLTSGPVMNTLNNLALILGAVLLMMPFGLIPFSNTFPAVALIFLAIGLVQRDGVCILLGYIANIATIIYFTALIAGGGLAIQEALRRVMG